VCHGWLTAFGLGGTIAGQSMPAQTSMADLIEAVLNTSQRLTDALGKNHLVGQCTCPFKHGSDGVQFIMHGCPTQPPELVDQNQADVEAGEPAASSPDLHPVSPAVASYVRFLQGWSGYAIIALLLLASALALPFALRLGSTTTTKFAPTPGSRSALEEKAIQAQFPGVFYDRETVYVHCEAPADCVCTASSCSGFEALLGEFLHGLQPYFEDETLVSTTSYFDLDDPLRDEYYNSAASSMVVVLDFSVNDEHRFDEGVQSAVDVGASLTSGGWTVHLSGQEAAMLSASKSIVKSMMMAENIGMLFIVLLFGWQIRSWRLVLIPMLNTMICLVVTDAILFAMSKAGMILLPSYVPNVCLFLAIALSVDYSFFHLSRFQEVRQKGESFIMAVHQMVATGGRVVLVSGIVLMFCWLALAAFPVFGTDSLGYSASITIFVCITVNVIMNPALILAFHQFFSNAANDPWRCCRRRQRGDARGRLPLLEDVADGEVHATNAYGKIAKRITTWPGIVLVPIIVYAVLVPMATRVLDADLIVGGISGHSASTSSTVAHILHDFPKLGGGVPLTVMLTPPATIPVQSNTYFTAGCNLARLLQAETRIAAGAFSGVSIRGGAGELSCYDWSGFQGAEKLLAQSNFMRGRGTRP
jgi:hypothetical protein